MFYDGRESSALYFLKKISLPLKSKVSKISLLVALSLHRGFLS